MRFKDDITIVTKSLEAGTKWQEGVLIVDPEKAINDAEKMKKRLPWKSSETLQILWMT